ncbi:hypothetical protein HanPSC8_Chr13g0550791 [Helianthus annuus]|nr:hypothetical protein HanPSC8_Chr13g0550791 [Helianthus annuus]
MFLIPLFGILTSVSKTNITKGKTNIQSWWQFPSNIPCTNRHSRKNKINKE